jgi:hypothetical protein
MSFLSNRRSNQEFVDLTKLDGVVARQGARRRLAEGTASLQPVQFASGSIDIALDELEFEETVVGVSIPMAGCVSCVCCTSSDQSRKKQLLQTDGYLCAECTADLDQLMAF